MSNTNPNPNPNPNPKKKKKLRINDVTSKLVFTLWVRDWLWGTGSENEISPRWRLFIS